MASQIVSMSTGVYYLRRLMNLNILPQKTYELKVPLFGCETHVNKEGNYENGIIIQENFHYLQSTDKKYLLTCIPAKYLTDNSIGDDGQQKFRDNLITVDFGGVTVDSSHTTTEIIRATVPSNAFLPSADLKYHVEIRAGHDTDSPVLTAPLNIGDPISYMVRLEKPVSDSQIGRCWASDSKSELELSDEKGCSLQPKGNIWGIFEKIDKNNEVVFVNKIKAWAFPTSNEVNIFCNLRVCMSRSCTFTNCTENSKDKRARRHHFSTLKSNAGMEEVETVKTKIRFKRDSLDTFRSSDLITQESEFEPLLCLTMGHLVLIIACLFFLILLIALIIFLFCPSKIMKK
uniref:ZP domain-containing protein n=1 Tax=Acrobeloides nanus TaxID=290746 RepID=A0A914BUX5_9BILA